MKNNNKWLLMLMIMAIGLAGCCRKRDKTCKTTHKREGKLVDMPVGKYAKNEKKTRLFDENVDAFILDEEAVHAQSDSQGNLPFAANKSGDVSWSDAQQKNEISQTIYFEYDSASITPEQKAQITASVEKVKQLTDSGKTVVFKGHSCRAGKASGAYNVALSNDRAHKTADIFAHSGVNKAKIKVFGVGYEEPAVMEDMPTRDGQAPNRRVEIYTINA
jgi:outer membrane protein OmpA-like peptidoglycan-associated protein